MKFRIYIFLYNEIQIQNKQSLQATTFTTFSCQQMLITVVPFAIRRMWPWRLAGLYWGFSGTYRLPGHLMRTKKKLEADQKDIFPRNQ